MTIDRTEAILLFLWRWKLVSTAALTKRFFPALKAQGAYTVLYRLERKKLIFQKRLEDHRKETLWSLTSLGFKAVQGSLPDLRQNCFRSEAPFHDYLVTAIHLGEWLEAVPPGCDLFSEQELRCYETADYPSWVPATQVHRPDGYWRVQRPKGAITIALEVERKIKPESFYRSVARFYEEEQKVFRVVWVVNSLPTAKTILQRLGSEANGNSTVHTFVLQKDLTEHGWQSPMHFGYESGKSIGFLLGMHVQKDCKNFASHLLFDSRKYPFDSKPCLEERKQPIFALTAAIASVSPVGNSCVASDTISRVQFRIPTIESANQNQQNRN